jgi:hypothetical protein
MRTSFADLVDDFNDIGFEEDVDFTDMDWMQEDPVEFIDENVDLDMDWMQEDPVEFIDENVDLDY